MNRLNIAALLVLLQLAPLFPQGISNPQVIYVLVDPSGPCGYGYITVNRLTGNTKGCVNGTWTNISGSIGPTGPTGPTGPNGFPVPTAQAVTSGITTSVVIPLNGTLTDKSQALPSCWTNASPSEFTLAYSGATMNAGLTQMTIDFSGTTTAGFTGTCTAIPSIGPTGPTGPTGPAGAGVSGLTAGTIPKAASATTLNDSALTVNSSGDLSVSPINSGDNSTHSIVTGNVTGNSLGNQSFNVYDAEITSLNNSMNTITSFNHGFTLGGFTIANVYGLKHQATRFGGGIVTNEYGISVLPDSAFGAGGTTTNFYGVFVGDLANPPAGITFTNAPYAFYATSGKSYFGDNVGMGTTTPAYGLDVSRGVGLTGTARFFDQTATTGSTLVTITPGAAQSAASTVLSLGGVVKFAGTNSTGAGSALLGTNSPAATNTAPYTWLTVVTSDGSTGFIPVWK